MMAIGNNNGRKETAGRPAVYFLPVRGVLYILFISKEYKKR